MNDKNQNLLIQMHGEPVGTYCIVPRHESHDVELSVRKSGPTTWQYLDSGGTVLLSEWARYMIDIEAVMAFS